MKYTFLISFMLLILQVSNASIDELQVNNEKAPSFIKPLLSLISIQLEKDLLDKELLSHLVALNTNLSNYPPSSTKAFFMSEFYKSFLQLEKNSSIKSTYSEVSRTNLAEAQKKLSENSLVISKMSEFLLVEIFLSYKAILDKKDESQTKKINQYLGSWIGEFLKRPIVSFDSLVSSVAINYIKSMAKLSKLIEIHSQKVADSDLVFPNLNEVMDKFKESNKAPKNTTKSDIQETVLPEISPTAGASEKIDELLKKVDSN